MAFRVGHVVDLIGQFAKSNGQQLEAELVSVDGACSVRQGFDPSTGKLKNAELMLLDAASAAALAERIRSGHSRHQRGRQAVHVTTVSTVHYQHAATRSQSQAWLYARTMQVRRACTRMATSPTCERIRRTWHRWQLRTARRLVSEEYGTEYLG